VPAGQGLDADTRVPAEFGRAGTQISGAVDCLDLAAIPAWSAQQERRHVAAGHAHEDRRLYRRLRDLLIDELERL